MKIDIEKGTIVLYTKSIDIKVDTNRDIYRRVKSEDSKDKVNFNSIDEKVPVGLSKKDKVIYILNLYRAYIESVRTNRQSGYSGTDDEDVEDEEE